MLDKDLRKAFLVSLPRSGSTLLQRLLGGHDQIISPNEPWILLRLLYPRRWTAEIAIYDIKSERIAVQQFLDKTTDGESVYAESVRLFADRMYEAFAENYISERKATEDSTYLMLDKTPRYYLVLPELRQVYPKAPIILLKRNPLAVLASIVRTWTGLDSQSPHFQNVLPDLLLAIDEINRFEMQMKGDTAVLLVKYEELLENPEKELKKLCKGLGIPFQNEMLTYDNDGESAGILGDKKTVSAHSAPEKKFAQRYKNMLSKQARFRDLAAWMLLYTGAEAIERFGYNCYSLLLEILENESNESSGSNFVNRLDEQTGGQLLNKPERLEKHFCELTELLLSENELKSARKWIGLTSKSIKNEEYRLLYSLMIDIVEKKSSDVQVLVKLGMMTQRAEIANKAAVFLSNFKLNVAIKIMRHAAVLAPEKEEIQSNLKALLRLSR